MATTTPLAYNPSASPIAGTSQVGTLAIGTSQQDYSESPGGVTWWMGPDEELGYVIGVPVSGNTQPTPISGVTASVGFYRSTGLTDISFVELTNQTFDQNFSSATDASVWLTTNGYWSSYPSPVLYLDAGNPSSYPGTGSTWTDVIGGKVFTLFNNPSYSGGFGGILNFNASSAQYAQCNTSLPNLNNWSVGVWTYYDGTNVGASPCIVTEVFPGTTFNINYSLGSLNDNNPYLQAGFFNAGWNNTLANYTLTPNNWYYIVGTYDGTAVRLYVNNTLINTFNTTTPSFSSNGGIRLMRRWDLGHYWGGLLGVVGIYDKSLTSGQISTIWNAQKSRFGL